MRSILLVISLVFISACAHQGGKSSCSQKKWDRMDANKDGKISKDEFVKMKTDKFMKMDTNNDGFVTKEEKEGKKKKGCSSCK